MNNLIYLLITVILITGCSFKIPPGNYTTADGPSFASFNFTFKENGRFKYNFSSDDGPPDIGHGGYIIIGNNILFLFENPRIPKTGYKIKETPCVKQDSQKVVFIVSQTSGEPLPFVSIYNKNDHSQGCMSQMDGVCELTIPKTQALKKFETHYILTEPMDIEFGGDLCVNIEITLKGEIDQLKRGDVKAAKLKRDGDKILIKMSNWREYGTLYQRTQ